MGMDIYHYRAFGINIASAIPCPQFLPGDGPPDVCIRYGEVPESLADATVINPQSQVAPDRFLLFRKSTARYLISAGREIVVQCDPGADPAAVQFYLLGTPLGALLHQRKLFPLHSNALVRDGGGVIVLGDRGSGKTTIAAFLLQRGFHVIADDICAISFGAGGEPVVPPGGTHLKVRDSAAAAIGLSTADMKPVSGAMDGKYWLEPAGKTCLNPVRLASIFTLSVSDVRQFTATPLAKMEAIDKLHRFTYRRKLIRDLNNKLSFLSFANAVASRVNAFQIGVPRERFCFEEIAVFIETAVAMDGGRS